MKLIKNYLTASSFAIVVFLSGSVIFNGCKTKSSRPYQLTGDTITDGRNLVRINCTKCHSLVPENALTKDVWQFHTLPSMAKYFGISTYGGNQYYQTKPDSAQLTMVEWQTIVSYYNKIAPALLPAAKKPVALKEDWAGFSLNKPQPAKDVSFTTMVAFNPANHKLYSANGHSGELSEWDEALKPRSVAVLPSPAVNALFSNNTSGANQAIITCIGRLEPIDFPNGRVVGVNLAANAGKTNVSMIATDLLRPVQTISADFDKDGLNDLVICGQGNLKGGVYLFKQNADHTYKQTTISEKPGAVQAVAGDFNNDGWQDIMVLFGSGDEGLWLFLNDHKGGFSTRNLLHFPPVYGSTSFQLADIDHDGKPDLIYTCGYNFRDSRILKPYHGLYIFKNLGDWKFKQQWFYPINGCTKAIAADFDGDGDLDIITSAFFADMKDTPAESVIYFEQDSPFNFKPHAIPVSKYGRWLAMDVADINNDGKPDVILGNYSSGFMFQPDFKPFWDKTLPLIVLKNQFKKAVK